MCKNIFTLQSSILTLSYAERNLFMQEILEKYQIRKSNKQKTDFIIYLTNRLKDIGYSDEDIHIEKRWKCIYHKINRRAYFTE